MKVHHFAAAIALVALTLFAAASIQLVHAQAFVQYKVQINADGAAAWTITQASGLNGTIDTWKEFQIRVDHLVSAAANFTQRQMNVDPNSLQLNTVWENESQTTQYQFTWLNFSITQGNRIVFGDVFGVSGFFGQLYGDGELQIIYPQNYTAASVSPPPNGGNNAPDTLDWLGTAFFVNGNPSVTLTPSTPSPTPNQTANSNGWETYAILGAVIVVAAIASSVGAYMLRRRKTEKPAASSAAVPVSPVVESEEGKILRFVMANGGTAFQSAITEQCKFSKSKTSQLLSELERRGVLTRYKKGRDKIVTLTVQGKPKGEAK